VVDNSFPCDISAPEKASRGSWRFCFSTTAGLFSLASPCGTEGGLARGCAEHSCVFGVRSLKANSYKKMQSPVGENMRFVYIAVSIASLGGFVVGYSIAVIAGAVLFIKQEFALSTTLEEVVVSSVLLEAMISAALGGKMADQIGRRQVVVQAAIILDQLDLAIFAKQRGVVCGEI